MKRIQLRRRRPAGSRWRRSVERLEPRLLLTATARDGIPYIDLGTSDNVAWDQPRVTIELLSDAAGAGSIGPQIFNQMLLDTGASTLIAMATAVSEMDDPPYPYTTEGKFEELGVAGVQTFDISASYRLDFAGKSGDRHTLQDTRIISDPVNDFSQFGPWGVIGMPTMVDRVTTLDMTVWETVSGLDLFMGVEFLDSVPESNGHRFSIDVDNRLEFDPEHGVVEGCCPPAWGDVPFLTAHPMHNGKVGEGNFLFDTGAQVSVLSERLGLQVGLDSNGDGVLNENDANFARFETVGGIGGFLSVPVFLFDEVHIPTKSGVDLVWTDLQWLVLDIIDGLDGVLGSDLLTSGWIEGFTTPGKSGWIDQIQMDFRNMNLDGTSVIHFDLNEQVDNLIDPNGPGARLIESGGSTSVSETGIDDSYQVVLTQQPAADVTINLVIPEPQLVAVDAASPANSFLVFTPANWNVPQTVHVSAVDDSRQESFHRSSIFHRSSSSDPGYQAVGMPRLIANIIDDEFAGMMLIPSAGETAVTEGGDSDTYGVVLTVRPTETVTLAMQAVGNQVSVVNDSNPQSNLVEFTPTNWNVPQLVRVTAIDDAFNEGEHAAYVSHEFITSAIEYRDAFGLQEFVRIIDNDAGGITVAPTTGLSTSETGGQATFSVALQTEPVADVIIPLVSSDTSEGTVSPARLTFTSENWQEAQVVTVTGINDDAVDGDVSYSIKTAAAISADPIYSGIDAADVEVINVDDDVAGMTVTSLIPTHNGFTVLLSNDLELSTLNLYDIESAGFGAADITLQGQSVGDVAGSLIVDESLRSVTFTKTGGPLESDLYTVTLRSATDGIKSTSGGLLDGDGDGLAGDDYVSSFNVLTPAAGAVTLGLPDFVRGPGQEIHLPADSTAGVPLSLSDSGAVRSGSLQVAYNPAYLELTGATLAAGMPISATVNLSVPVPGLAVITFSSPVDLPSGRNTIIQLQAAVPADGAIYSQQHVLDVHAVDLLDSAGVAVPSIDDDAVHSVAYFGDTSGNGRINATDASLVARVSSGIDGGFASSPLIDPRIAGDISGNRRVNAIDASLVAQFVALHDVPEIPAIPSGVLAAAAGNTRPAGPPDAAGPLRGRVSLADVVGLQITGLADRGPANGAWVREYELLVGAVPSEASVGASAAELPSAGDPTLSFTVTASGEVGDSGSPLAAPLSTNWHVPEFFASAAKQTPQLEANIDSAMCDDALLESLDELAESLAATID